MKLKIVGEIMTENSDGVEYAMARAEAEVQAEEARERMAAQDYTDWREAVNQRFREYPPSRRPGLDSLERELDLMGAETNAVATLQWLYVGVPPELRTEGMKKEIEEAYARINMQLLRLTDEVYLYPVLPFSGKIRGYDPLRKRYVILKPRTVEPTEESVIGPLDEATLKKLADYITYPVAEVLDKRRTRKNK